MTFEERFGKKIDKDSRIICSTHLRDMISRGRSQDHCKHLANKLKPIIIELREALVAIQEFMEDEQGNILSDRDANTKQVRIARAAQTRVDEFFGGKGE